MLYSTSGIIENLDSGASTALRIFIARVKNAILENQNEDVSDDWQIDNWGGGGGNLIFVYASVKKAKIHIHKN